MQKKILQKIVSLVHFVGLDKTNKIVDEYPYHSFVMKRALKVKK